MHNYCRSAVPSFITWAMDSCSICFTRASVSFSLSFFYSTSTAVIDLRIDILVFSCIIHSQDWDPTTNLPLWHTFHRQFLISSTMNRNRSKWLQVHNICMSQLAREKIQTPGFAFMVPQCTNVDGVVLNIKYVPVFIGARKYKGKYSHEWGWREGHRELQVHWTPCRGSSDLNALSDHDQ